MISFIELGKLGRLGNQLFQIASTIGYARKYGQEYCFNNWNYSQFFNVPIYGCNSQFTHRIDDTDSLGYWNLPEYTINMGDVDLYGYFQSEKYFIHCKYEILRLLKSYQPVVDYGFIHIRRGDYVNLSHYHTNLSIEYYINGMDILGFRRYYCFSDDIEWCKSNISDDRLVFVENTSEIQDLMLMQRCLGGVIANSSFSWWGAYLSESKKVIIPKNWFGPSAGKYNIDDKLCEGWISI